MAKDHQKIPSWLTAMVDQRLALIDEHLSDTVPTATMVMSALTEPPEDATKAELDRWDRTCDNCGRYCSGDFFTGQVIRTLKDGRPVYLTFGVCLHCKW